MPENRIDWSRLNRRPRRPRSSLPVVLVLSVLLALGLLLALFAIPWLRDRIVEPVGLFPESSAEYLPFVCLAGVLVLSLLTLFATAVLKPGRALCTFSIVACAALIVGFFVFGVRARTLDGMIMAQVGVGDVALTSAQLAVFLLPAATLLGFGFSAGRWMGGGGRGS